MSLQADDMSDGTSLRQRLGLVALFLLILVLVALDVAEDVQDGAPMAHVAGEVVIMAAAIAGTAWMLARLLASRRIVRVLEKDLARARTEAERFRNETRTILEGLSAAISRQFERWELTPAESEVGLLLLKGLSHKEIAALRETSERTVRHQALAVYRKAGLAGRAELSAFFLEDLLLPQDDAPR